MVERNLSLPYQFVCFTENTTGLNKNIRVEPLPVIPVTGWWFKPYFFNPELPLKGTVLFLDLDLIVFNNIDCLFTHKPGEFLIIKDFNRKFIRNYDRFNSSVFRLETGMHKSVYRDFIKDIDTCTKKFKGDQDWMYHKISSNYSFWPDAWIQSYKWEMRQREDLVRQSGKFNFKTVAQPTVDKDTKIAVFHGEPNPHECKDPWCETHWR